MCFVSFYKPWESYFLDEPHILYLFVQLWNWLKCYLSLSPQNFLLIFIFNILCNLKKKIHLTHISKLSSVYLLLIYKSLCFIFAKKVTVIYQQTSVSKWNIIHDTRTKLLFFCGKIILNLKRVIQNKNIFSLPQKNKHFPTYIINMICLPANALFFKAYISQLYLFIYVFVFIYL